MRHNLLIFQPSDHDIDLSATGSSLTEMPDRLRDVFENLIVGCQILDNDLRYIYINAQAAAHGRRKPEELLGRRMVDAYPGIETTEVYAKIVHCKDTGQSERFDNEFAYEDGSVGIFELSIQGIPEGVLIASIDVTQERELAQRLLQAQKLEAVGRLAGGVAHDFNNLLTVIKGHCDLLQSGLTPAQQAESIAAIRNAGGRAARLTRQLLSISRHAQVQLETLDLSEQLERSREFIISLLGVNCTLKFEFQRPLPTVLTDAGQFEQTIMNLVLNARDAMTEGGSLCFRAEDYVHTGHGHSLVPEMRPGRYLYLQVIDTGCGIEADVLPRIFEPFFTTKEIGRGTGLGLAVVHGAVRQAGGYIAVASEPGQGTTFHLFYPVAFEHQTMETSANSTLQAPRPCRILLVEDEDSVRKIVRLSLEKQQCQVIECGTPEQAIQLVNDRTEIDLLVTDVVMPNMRGPELARALQAVQPKLRVLYMSGYADESIGLKHALRPCDDFLQKPFSPSDLVRRVQNLLT